MNPPPFPRSRPRRLRRDAATRALVREHRLSSEDLILPVFVLDGQGLVQDVASMPGVQRRSVDGLFAVAEQCVQLGVPVMALFPVGCTVMSTRSKTAKPTGLVSMDARAWRAERAVPGLSPAARASVPAPAARRRKTSRSYQEV